MKTNIELITPFIAEKMLRNNKANRKLDRNTVKKYANDMEKGLWELSHQGIAFNKDGVLIDGQHRLNAIIMANKDVYIQVTRDVPDGSYHIDRPRTRSLFDNLSMGYANINPDLVNKRILEGVRAIFRSTGASGTTIKDSDIVSFCNMYEKQLLEISPILKKQKLKFFSASTFSASYIMAYINGVSINTLNRFDDILRTGFYENPEEKPIIALRNYIVNQSSKGLRVATDTMLPRIHYAIRQYDIGKCTTRSIMPDELIYKVEFRS